MSNLISRTFNHRLLLLLEHQAILETTLPWDQIQSLVIFYLNKTLLLNQMTKFIFLAIYTQPGGLKTTTIKNALSDLYNITTTENNLINSIQKKNLYLFLSRLQF
jgi:hypothetical protein